MHQTDFEILLSRQVFETLEWLEQMIIKLSRAGTASQHPDWKIRLRQHKVKTILKIAENDTEQREKSLKLLLITASEYFDQVTKEHCTPSKLGYNKGDATKYDIEVDGRSYRNSLLKTPILSSDKNEVLGFADAPDNQTAFFSKHHLELIEENWLFLRVQIKILNIQLSSKSQQNVEESNSKSFFEYPEEKDLSTLQLALFNKQFSESTLERNHSEITDTSTEDMEEKFKLHLGEDVCSQDGQSTLQSGLSPRDDGYYSKAGESAADESHDDADTTTTEVDSALQFSTSNLSKLNLREIDPLECTQPFENTDNKQAVTQDFIDQEAISLRNKSFNEEKWDQIYEVVERFSQNTLTLLSWLEELKDLSQQNKSTQPCFYDSSDARRGNITVHTQRVYKDVMEDATVLLRHLPSEKTTILAVLQKVELKCDGFDICDSDDITELSTITASDEIVDHDFLSTKLKSELVSTMTSYDEFQPHVMSSPRQSTSKPPPIPIIEKSHPTRVTSKAMQMLQPVQKPLLYQPSTQLRNVAVSMRWSDFIKECNAIHDWLDGIETTIRRTEIGDLTRSETHHMLEICSAEFKTNFSRRQKFSILGNYLSDMCPELRYDIRERLSGVKNVWDVLELRTRTPRTRYRKLSLSPSRLSGALWRKQSLPLPKPEVQLSDFSLHQIRDRLGFGSENSCTFEKCRKSIDNHIKLTSNDDDYFQCSRGRSSAFKERSLMHRPNVIHRMVESRYGEHRKSLDMSTQHEVSSLIQKGTDLPETTHLSRQEETVVDHISSKANGQPQLPGGVDLATMSFTSTLDDVKSLAFDVESPRIDEEDIKSTREDDEDEADAFLASNPFLLSSRILEFHGWLKVEELEAYSQLARPGWDPQTLKKLHKINRNRLNDLQSRELILNRILTSAEKVLNAEESDDETESQVVDYDALLWTSVMLHLRYLNLILYSLDLDCILERRIDVLSKNSIVALVIAHPTENIWGESGIDMICTAEISNEDYSILRKQSV